MKATEALLWAIAATVAILVAGLLLLCALRGWDWTDREFRLVLLAATAPWAVLSWLALGNLRPTPRHVMLQESLPDNIRLIPIHHGGQGPGTTIEGIERTDLAAFVDGLATRGHSSRAWLGQRLPSGKTIDQVYHAALVNVLEKAGYVRGRGPRNAGQLVETDAQTIRTTLGLH